MAEREVGRGLDPFPAFAAQRLGLARELLGDEPVEQRRVLEPAAIVVLEQIARDDAAGRLVGVKSDKLRPLVGGADRALGELAADVIRLLVVGPRKAVPDLLLARVVVGDREGHELLKASSRPRHRDRAAAARPRQA